MPCHFHSRFFQYHLMGPVSFRGINGDYPLIISTYTKLSSTSFNLKKSSKVKEMVEHFKEIGNVPIIIVLKSISSSSSLVDLQLD